MTETKIAKAKKLGQLLAASPLSDEIKQALLDNMEFMPESNLDALIISLENEERGLEIVAQEAEVFMKKQDEDWDELEIKQKAAADKILKEEMKKLEDEARIEALKGDLASA